MRIIAGSLRRRTIRIPKGLPVRPTTDRVREAVFNWLEARIDLEGARVLDLFAGSGLLGFEALSRGAESVTAVELNHRVGDVLESNAALLGVHGQYKVVRSDVRSWLSATRRGVGPRPFDLIFADPPYAWEHLSDLPGPAGGLLNGKGVLVIEHGGKGSLASHSGFVEQRKYGRTSVAYMKRVEES